MLLVQQIRPYIENLSKIADTNVLVYPNAGLPNEFGDYDQSPEIMAGYLNDFIDSSFVNIIEGAVVQSQSILLHFQN